MKFYDIRPSIVKLDSLVASFPTVQKQKQLVILQVGENKVSEKYVQLKKSYCDQFNINCKIEKLLNPTFVELKTFISSLALDETVKSIIVQLPLFDQSFYSLLNLIPLSKDVDLLSKNAKDQFYSNNFTHLSPVVRAVEHFLVSNNLKDLNFKVGIIGYGELVGRPLEKYLSSIFKSVTVLTNYQTNQQLDFDLLILSTDVANLVNGQDLKKGCNVVDFGATSLNKKLLGNLNLNSELEHLGIISKSPGGMGPLVVRYLVLNHLEF